MIKIETYKKARTTKDIQELKELTDIANEYKDYDLTFTIINNEIVTSEMLNSIYKNLKKNDFDYDCECCLVAYILDNKKATKEIYQDVKEIEEYKAQIVASQYLTESDILEIIKNEKIMQTLFYTDMIVYIIEKAKANDDLVKLIFEQDIENEYFDILKKDILFATKNN